MTMIVIGVVAIVLMCVGLYWIGGIYFTIHNGLDEIIKGLNSLDQRLSNLEERNPVGR